MLFHHFCVFKNFGIIIRSKTSINAHGVNGIEDSKHRERNRANGTYDLESLDLMSFLKKMRAWAIHPVF